MNAEKLKRLSVQIMIGGLIGAAAIAVVAVLVGSFNDTLGKALGTLFLVMAHALASLAFIDKAASKDQQFKFFENAFFAVIVLSFFTSIFGVWGIVDGDLIAKLYGTYGIILFACLHGQMLTETRGSQSRIDTIVNVNYALMGVVILMFLPIIWASDSSTFPGVYFRILAAVGIVDATLTILAVILHKMYIQKHPKQQSAIFSVQTQLDANGQPIAVQTVQQKRRVHPLIILLGIYIFGQIALSLFFGIAGRL